MGWLRVAVDGVEEGEWELCRMTRLWMGLCHCGNSVDRVKIKSVIRMARVREARGRDGADMLVHCQMPGTCTNSALLR